MKYKFLVCLNDNQPNASEAEEVNDEAEETPGTETLGTESFH